MSSLHNDLEMWANKAKSGGRDRIELDLKTAYKLAAMARLDLPQALQSARAQGRAEASEFAWLVESFSGQTSKYLSDFEEAYAGTGFAWFPEWTSDHSKALRFAREEDAAKIARSVPSTSKAKAVQHGWHE